MINRIHSDIFQGAYKYSERIIIRCIFLFTGRLAYNCGGLFISSTFEGAYLRGDRGLISL